MVGSPSTLTLPVTFVLVIMPNLQRLRGLCYFLTQCPPYLARLSKCWKTPMKQLDVDVSPPAFLCDPYLTLAYVTFDLNPCDL